MKKKILVIEDELDMRKNIATILELNGYEVICAPNGEIGLQLALQNIPDLIISDILMPQLDGFELLEELRKHPETFMIPFLFLTAKTERKDVRKGMQLGADDYITKPFSIEELLESVKARVEHKEKSQLLIDNKFEQLRSAIRETLPHEMRTPLNTILDFTDLLLKNYESITPEASKEMLKNIYQSAQRLYGVTEKYIFYVNLELIASNPKELENYLNKRTYSVEPLIKEIAQQCALKYGRAEDLKYSLKDSALKISKEFFSRIIEEIIDNAFKFSKKGTEVIITANKNLKMFILAVTNYGHGIEPRDITSIGPFMRFNKKTYKQQGLGLGLFIAKKLTEIHHGNFTLESEVEYFTRVIIELPVAESNN